MMRWEHSSTSSSSAEPPTARLTTLQSFLIITSSVCGQLCVGAVFILNFYISYFISYVKLRGSYSGITLQDGKFLLLAVAGSYGLSGYPLGCLMSGIPTMVSLTIGAGCYLLGYVMVYVGIEFAYTFVILGCMLLGVSSMMVNIAILLHCLSNFKEHWGIVSGTLLGVAFGSTGLLHIWEIAVVNPLNILPVTLGDDDRYYESNAVLDRCAQLYWGLGIFLGVLLIFPLVVYRMYPCPPTREEENISCRGTCSDAICNIWTDVRFILIFTAFGFGGVSGLCTRSSLKVFGETFIADEQYITKVGASGSLAAAVGSISMGIILDIASSGGTSTSGSSSKLALFNCLLGFTGSVMMMFAPNFHQVWYLFCYDIILFAFGGFSAILTMVLLEIFGISKFAVAFGITSLLTFFSAMWYTFSVLAGLPWRDFWLANALFGFTAVVSAIGLLLQEQAAQGEVGETEEEEEEDCIFHEGKKYHRFSKDCNGIEY